MWLIFSSRNKDKFPIFLVAMSIWVIFLFTDIIDFGAFKNVSRDDLLISEVQHFSAEKEINIVEKIEEKEKINLSQKQTPVVYEYEKDSFQKAVFDVTSDLQLSVDDIRKLKIKNLRKDDVMNTLEDIFILEKLYEDTNKVEILWLLIEKLAQDFQFEKAYQLSQKFLGDEVFENIDPNLYFHIMINSSVVSIMKPESIEVVRNKIEEARTLGVLSVDDYRFYQGLMKIWYNDYEWAKTLFKQLTLPHYQKFFETLENTLSNISVQEDVPIYYQDSMVALVMLKHWYFSVAKKLALEVVLKNEDYILPYQILAYSHFLTNDWEVATKYFLKLVDIDSSNEYLYKFLIGVSYYWDENYEKSVLYVSQVEDAIFEENNISDSIIVDMYRYLVLNYVKLEESERLVWTRQNLLGIDWLEKSDFYTYFYEVLYRPFIEWDSYDLYKENVVLAENFVDVCYKKLSEDQQDICVYGRAGLDILNQRNEEAQSKLLYLAQHYPQSYIFHTLWDLYYRQTDYAKAKIYYLKSISMTDSESEEVVLKYKLTELAIGF